METFFTPKWFLLKGFFFLLNASISIKNYNFYARQKMMYSFLEGKYFFNRCRLQNQGMIDRILISVSLNDLQEMLPPINSLPWNFVNLF